MGETTGTLAPKIPGQPSCEKAGHTGGMRAFLILALAAPGCGGHYGARQHANAAMNVALATAVLIAQSAAAPKPIAPKDRPTHLTDPLDERARTDCGRGFSYVLVCRDDGSACFYRNNFGLEYGCEPRDCSQGPPSALVRWCTAD